MNKAERQDEVLGGSPSVLVVYTASGAVGGIKIKCADVPLELHQMLIWCLTRPDMAARLLPAYLEVRAEARDEGE